MKRTLCIAVLLFGTLFGSFGQDKTAELKKLLEVMQSEKMIDAMMDNVFNAMQQQAQMQFQGEGAEEKTEEFLVFMKEEAIELTKIIVNEEMVKIYEKHFSYEDIKGLIAFYESPTGQKLLEKTPEITTDLMNVMMSKHMPEFQQKIAEKMQQLSE